MKCPPFYPADILLPARPGEKWSVVACDQFTSQPEYWEELNALVGSEPSTLRITLPEIYLGDREEERIAEINSTMEDYLARGLFTEYPDAMIYLERTLPDGSVRRGLVGAVDLEEYDFRPEKQALIRATEGTVLSRIPPRVKIRRGAALELPHVMVLIDDPGRTVIEPLAGSCARKVYDYPLSMGGGHLRGWLVEKPAQQRLLQNLAALAGEEEHPLLFAVGDGNHSLATAKACYQENPTPLNRYALVELVNLHDDALEFEPIYRVLFGVNPEELAADMGSEFAGGDTPIALVSGAGEQTFFTDGFALSRLQPFLDGWLAAHPGAEIDYIHGEEVARRLGSGENCCALLYGAIRKDQLFDIIRTDGVLPRKSFSMGEAAGKRYYTEARKIR